MTFKFCFCRSAFFWFSNDERGKVKAQNPEYGVGDIAKELGRRWAEADADTKGKYEQLADKDKARYEKVSKLILVFLNANRSEYQSFEKKSVSTTEFLQKIL